MPYRCTGCGACRSSCPSRNDVPGLLSLARSRVFQRGAAPEEVREVCGAFAVAGNPQGRDFGPVLQTVLEQTDRSLDRVADDVFLPGCASLAQGPQEAQNFLQALSLLARGRLAVTPASSLCCGLALWWAGELEAFRAHAQMVQGRLRGVRRLVVHDPACALGMRTRYAEVGVDLTVEVVSAVDFVAGLLPAEKRSVESHAQSVVFVDNCNQAEAGIPGSGFRILKRASGENVIEVSADCCGAAGLLPQTAPDVATAMAHRWLDSIRATAPDGATIVTPSPRCRAHLTRTDPAIVIEDPSRLLVRM